MHGKKNVVAKYMAEYDRLITDTIVNNNDHIYKGLAKFLCPKSFDYDDNANSQKKEKVGLEVQGVGG